MPFENDDIHRDETHEQFVQRASRVFPKRCVRAWSRVERGVFNHLMGRLIHRYSYASITDAMLHQCRNDMDEIVRRFGGAA